MGQNKQIDNIWETERQTWKQDRKESDSFSNIVDDIDVDVAHECLLELCYILKSFIDSQI